jgi:hypothetical protein
MNMSNYWPIDYAAEMCNVPKAALLRMDREGLVTLVPHEAKLWVGVNEIRRVVEAAEDCPSLLCCTCIGPCLC